MHPLCIKAIRMGTKCIDGAGAVVWCLGMKQGKSEKNVRKILSVSEKCVSLQPI